MNDSPVDCQNREDDRRQILRREFGKTMWFKSHLRNQKESNPFGLLFFLLVVLVATTWAQGYEPEGRITRR